MHTADGLITSWVCVVILLAELCLMWLFVHSIRGLTLKHKALHIAGMGAVAIIFLLTLLTTLLHTH